MSIGKRIRKRRRAFGLTQEEAAERCGLSPQFFSCVERGIKSVRAESIVKISLGLAVSTDYLLLGVMGEQEQNKLFVRLKALNAVQRNFIETVVQSYLAACESHTLD